MYTQFVVLHRTDVNEKLNKGRLEGKSNSNTCFFEFQIQFCRLLANQ